MVNCRGLIACLLVGLVMKASSASEEPSHPLAIGNARFTSAFFDQIRSQEGNLFFSPMSIELLLALAHRGAQGKTATQIQQAAHLLDDQYPWMETLESDENITLILVNEIIADESVPIKQDYIDFVENRLKAEVGQVNLRESVLAIPGTKVSVQINLDWDASQLLLHSGASFQADWDKIFNYAQKGVFHLNEQQGKEVDFMQVQDLFSTVFNRELDAHIVEIPYKDNNVSMILVVPNTINGLADLESKIANYDLLRLTEGAFLKPTILTMPKFKLNKPISLKSSLIKMGVEDLFDPLKANLSGLAETPLSVSHAFLTTYMEVNEEGTRATTAPAPSFVTESFSCIHLSRHTGYVSSMLVDRPFLFFLKHKPTGLYLFMGRIASP